MYPVRGPIQCLAFLTSQQVGEEEEVVILTELDHWREGRAQRRKILSDRMVGIVGPLASNLTSAT